MEFGLILPNYRAGSSPEGLEAAADAAERLGFSTVWTTDHVIVDHATESEYGRIFDAILTLAHLGARNATVKLGVSVIVVPYRSAAVLAKEIATLDALTRGRVICGVGVGWNQTEFGNLGVADRYHVRGAYLDEAIRLWRHLWAGRTDPFEGRFTSMTDFVFEPLPVQPGGPPIIVGGRSEAALRRAGTVGDGYHFSSGSPADIVGRVAVVRAAAEAAGRPMPPVSGRVRLSFDQAPKSGYAMRGSAEQVATEVRAFGAAGVSHIAIALDPVDPERYVAIVERFAGDVIPLAEGS